MRPKLLVPTGLAAVAVVAVVAAVAVALALALTPVVAAVAVALALALTPVGGPHRQGRRQSNAARNSPPTPSS